MAVYRESVVARIDCDPAALLWAGYYPLALPADAVIATGGEVALGGGELVSVPDFQLLIGGTAQRLDFAVSGVSAETVRLALEDAPSVRGARVDIGIIHFNEDWSVAEVEWENTFEARSLKVSRSAEQNGQATRTISLTIVQGDSRRSRSINAFFTDADQRRKSPTDAIFSNVGAINGGTSRRFGPSDA